MQTGFTTTLKDASKRVASAVHHASEVGSSAMHRAGELGSSAMHRASGVGASAVQRAGEVGHELLSPEKTFKRRFSRKKGFSLPRFGKRKPWLQGSYFAASEAGMPLFVGLCTGGAIAFLFDPSRGRSRRALIRDKAVRFRRKAGEAADVAYRDVRNRAVGLASEVRYALDSRPADDDRVEKRARMALRCASSHPRAIEVEVTDGITVVRGPVLASEADDVTAALRGVRGIRDVVDELDRYESPDSVPALQGEDRRIPGNRLTPATRAVLAIGVMAAAAPLFSKAAASRRFLSISPALFAGVVGFAALSIAMQERAALRGARQAAGDARDDDAFTNQRMTVWEAESPAEG